MCETADKLKFCTCLKDGDVNTIIHHKNSRRSRQKQAASSGRVYKWRLSSYAGDAKWQMEGMLMEPLKKLNNEMGDNDVATELNERDCFDFQYDPQDGDNLELWTEPRNFYAPMSFIFKGGQWVISHYNGFTDKTEEFNKGIIKFE
ncbi:hypothetical protein [Flavobacterium sp.]|uniref:hypothetical protein n=1 Tax=Flavobacterium sp. TaxID=239 RepID=UPI0040349F16